MDPYSRLPSAIGTKLPSVCLEAKNA